MISAGDPPQTLLAKLITILAVDMKFPIYIHIHIHRFSVDIHGYIHIHRRLSWVQMY